MNNNVKTNKEKILSTKYIIILAVITLLTFLVSLYVVGFAIICGPSMQPTFDSGDIVLVNKYSKTYERNDIVIIKFSGNTIVKRIVGLPGDTVQIKDGLVYINDKPYEDAVDCETTFAGTAYEPLTLGKDEYFVLGDNREESMDSRYEKIGILKSSQFMGRVIFSFIPPSFVS